MNSKKKKNNIKPQSNNRLDVITEKSINDVNYELLQEQFPHAVSIDDSGKYVIDSQKLQLSLNPAKAEIKEDGYGLNWVGKKEAYHKAFAKNYKILKPLISESINWDDTSNILIKGDNIDALKILRHNYFESIKMIYIDPPYNTKSDEFIYNDNFTYSTEQTLEELGYDKDYIEYIENIHGARTHSGWLNFMYPRLLLAKDLLTDDGVIFISIDDNEQAQNKLLCDEIYGEENFVSNIIWDKSNAQNDANRIQKNHEYVLCYTKNLTKSFYTIEYEEKKIYKNKHGKYIRGSGLTTGAAGGLLNRRPNLGSTIYYKKSTDDKIVVDDYDKELAKTSNNENEVYKDRKDLLKKGYIIIRPPKKGNQLGRWTWKLDKFKKNLMNIDISDDGQVYKIEFIDNNIKGKVYKKKKINKPKSIVKDISSGSGTKILNKLLGENNVFSNSKPTELIKHLINISNLNDNDIVLDFFSGSGTSAHAILDMNATDGGSRKFICVQLEELTPENSVARNAGYSNIFDIAKARITKVGELIKNNPLSKQSIDTGFRVFEISEDRKQTLYNKSLEFVNQNELIGFMDNSNIASNVEILYNLFIIEGFPLNSNYKEIIKDKLFLAHNVAFILNDITSVELIEGLKDHKNCEYITIYGPNISDDKLILEIESNISTIGLKPDKLRFRG